MGSKPRAKVMPATIESDQAAKHSSNKQSDKWFLPGEHIILHVEPVKPALTAGDQMKFARNLGKYLIFRRCAEYRRLDLARTPLSPPPFSVRAAIADAEIRKDVKNRGSPDSSITRFSATCGPIRR
jgi:hypothetical protein